LTIRKIAGIFLLKLPKEFFRCDVRSEFEVVPGFWTARFQMDPVEFASDLRPAFDVWAAPHQLPDSSQLLEERLGGDGSQLARFGGSSNRQLLLNVANVLKECDRVKFGKDGLQLLLP
jgi:hypothetical protein